MAHITIFIDETGSFSFKNKTSYVGGWVCKTDNVKSVEARIRNSVHYFNDYLKSKEIRDSTLEYPGHMHFMPLLVASERYKDKKITTPIRYVPIFFENLFSSFSSYNIQVFRSTGKPIFMPNEQAVYIDILRNTLLQIVDELVATNKKLTLDIVIAHRRIKMLYGNEGYNNVDAYEKHLIEGLERELVNAFSNDKPKITISFNDARYHAGLIMADFYCGAQRWTEDDYLKDYKNIRRYPFNNGYKQIGGRVEQQLHYIKEHDVPTAAILAIDVLSAKPNATEIRSILFEIIKGMSKSEKSIFCKNIIEIFDERLVNDPDRYSFLDSMSNVITILFEIFNSDYKDMEQIELRLVATLMMNKIRIESHQGKTNDTSTNAFLEFLTVHGENAFNNQMEIMQQRIDAVLKGVQINAFNTFKFDLVEKNLKKIKEQYYKMFDFSFETETETLKDNNRARIEGTLGQMYGFLYDIEQDSDYFELAEISLKNDIKASIDNTPSLEQAHGYLTTLYCKNGNLEKAEDQFIIESNSKNDIRDEIYNLNYSKTFQTHEKPFIQLHRLHLCALAAKNGTRINGLDNENEMLLKQANIHKYPRLLSAKWLAILFLLNNDYQSADGLLNKALTKDCDDKTIDAIRIPLKIIQHHVSLTLGKSTSFSCEDEVNRLGDKQKEFKEVLIKCGVEKYYKDEEKWSVYEIGNLLPFYFS